jgi:hypothetical protein
LRFTGRTLVGLARSWTNSTGRAIAVVATPGRQPVVSDLDCVVIEGVDTAHVEQLGTVVDAALAWVNGQIESQIIVIRDDLLARGYDELLALPAPTLTIASSGSIKQRRT